MANTKARTGHAGNIIGQSDDDMILTASDDIESVQRWAAERWPENGCRYMAVVWIEDDDGNVLDSRDVTIDADGRDTEIG